MTAPVVLLVDDNPDHRFLATRALRDLVSEGRILVETADDGDAGLQRMRRTPAPGLVLLDIKMPRKDGFEVLREARADPSTSRLYVLMLSSSENKGDQERARELGADGYVTKPLDARAFQEAMRKTVAAWLAR